VVTVESDQRCGGQRRRLDRDPQKPHVLSRSDERHAGEEEQQAAHEPRLGRVREQLAFFEVAVRLVALAVEVAQGVSARDRKKNAGDRQQQKPQSIDDQPVAPQGAGPPNPHRRHQREVPACRPHENPAS